MTDIAELNTGSEYNNTLKTLRECGGVDEWVALDKFTTYSRTFSKTGSKSHRRIRTLWPICLCR